MTFPAPTFSAPPLPRPTARTSFRPRAAMLLGVLGALLLGPAAPGAAQLRPLAEDRGVVGLGLKLRKVASGVSVLAVTAHPDDENNALHALLSRGMGARVSLLTLTRGGGGQNEIGPELFDGLRVLRTEELRASHRLDAVEQYFGMVSDFGYSFSVEETLEKWGREETVGDVVRMIRALRPDVVLALPPSGPGGGQHHMAAGVVTIEAFEAAGDPARFPEHEDLGLRPWTPRRLYVAGVGGGRAGDPAGEVRTVRIETAVWDPLLGRTYAALGQEARSAHRCQGMGQLGAPAGSRVAVLREAASTGAPAPPGADGLFAGIPEGLTRLAAFIEGTDEAGSERAREALEAFDASVAEAAASSSVGADQGIPAIRAALSSLRRLLSDETLSGLTAGSRFELEHRLVPKEAQLEEALALAHGIVVDPVADAGAVSPGGSLGASVAVSLGGPTPVTLASVEVVAPDGWRVARRAEVVDEPAPAFARGRAPAAPPLLPGDLPKRLDAGRTERADFQIAAPEDAGLSRPPWRVEAGSDRLIPSEDVPFGAAVRPPALAARVRFESGGVPAAVTLPLQYRYEGPWVGAEKQKEVSVLPAGSVRVSPEIVVFPRGAGARPLSVEVTWRGRGAADFSVVLRAPDGFAISPETAEASFSGPGVRRVEFHASAPPDSPDGAFRLIAEARLSGSPTARPFDETVEEIAYHHVETRHLFRPAEARALVLDAEVAPVRVGYVEGVGDDVAEAIGQLGLPVAFLDEADLAGGNLNEFDTIVLGVRAYLARPDLRTHNRRLIEFVEAGGTLLVQYNKFEFNAGEWGPYPAAVGRGRITVEDAPMEVLDPGHPAFRFPNRIVDADFAGWVQERGLYFLSDDRDARYQDLLASEDPWPNNAGEKRGILVEARAGSGRWLYLGVGLWRQLPAGTPGAYRLLANLLSLGHGTADTDQP